VPHDATRTVALLGPTNTGKTHQAVERMLEYPSGMIGLPLRLLAREVYDRVSARLGEDRVALVTGEEKRVPAAPDYFVCTTEAMPLSREVDFVAVDEIQLATHEERGHVFTERLLHARGRKETWFMGAATMRGVVETLVPAARHEERPRLSELSFVGADKLSRLRPRTAVVAFSLTDLYAIAGRLSRLRGGVALVLGALSPRARNAQVALFQAGEVDVLVATDAIGMGLNLDVEHVAFAALRKFDGQRARELEPAEVGQIAGRAGRFLRPGTFGSVLPLALERDLVTRVETHRFEPVRRVRYRNSELDFSSPSALHASLHAPPWHPLLAGVTRAEDTRALEAFLRDAAILDQVRTPADVELLWRVCQVPDFRGILFEVHLDLLKLLWANLREGPLRPDFLREMLEEFARTDGDTDTLMARIARLRTWTFVANQGGWVRRAAEIQAELAALEDRLSDALHAALVERFVERRTRTREVSPPKPRANRPLPARDDAAAFRPFSGLDALKERLVFGAAPPAPHADDLARLADLPHEAFSIDDARFVCAEGRRLAKLTRGRSLVLPELRFEELADVSASVRLRLERRLRAYTRDWVGRLLAPVRELARAEVPGLRAVAYQLEAGLGTALREPLEPSLALLGPAEHARLDELGVHVGRITVSVTALSTPAARSDRARLVYVHHASPAGAATLPVPPCPRGSLAPETWLALDAVALGPWVLRTDLAERAAEALATAQNVERLLGSFGVPRRERARVVAALGCWVKPPPPARDSDDGRALEDDQP
jgi:ATP-dependent RNA helicase SUPV3L1/SUV3